MKRSFAAFLFVLCLGHAELTSAQEAAQEKTRDPEKNFEFVWHAFDRGYCNFPAKAIDWDLIYKVYRPRVTQATTDDELFSILSSMLAHLNDNHVNLMREGQRFNAGILEELKSRPADFSLKLVKTNYLKDKVEERQNGNFQFSFLIDSIGYLHFNSFRNSNESAAIVDEVLQAFKNCKAMIVDVRGNGGGDDEVGKAIADRFSDGAKRLYMVRRMRTGPGHMEFGKVKEFYVEPEGPAQFTKPVILLTHRHSVSAAENFTLGMRRLPHVTVVGATTSGAMADVRGRPMPNGWTVWVPYNYFVDHNGFCWEGMGLVPHIRQINTKEDIDAGKDKVLELAIALIESGGLKNRTEQVIVTE